MVYQRMLTTPAEMKVKISTNEKFHAITVLEPFLAANMTAEFLQTCTNFLTQEVRNLLLNLKDIQKMDNAAATTILELRNTFYANNSSFVLCELQPSVKKYFDENEQFCDIQITPTQSEASDIIFMEEIERELLD